MSLKKKNKLKKKKYSRKIEIKEQPTQAPVTMTYDNAMALANTCADRNLSHGEYILEQIVEALPDDLDLHLSLLEGYVAARHMDKAKRFIPIIQARFPNDSSVMRGVARCYLRLGEDSVAIEWIERAIKQKPKDAHNHYFMARFYQSAGDIELAVESYKKAIELEPNNPMFYVEISKVLKNKMPSEYLKKIETLLISKMFHGFDKAQLHFSVAWSYGDSDPDKSFKHLARGNRIITEMHPSQLDIISDEFDRLTDFINFDLVEKVASKGNKEYSPIMIATMPRSGSTLLEQILGAHSKTYPVGESNALTQAIEKTGHRMQLGRRVSGWQGADIFSECLPVFDKYFKENYFIDCAGDKRVVDKSIDNYRYIGVLLQAYPQAKVIHLRRDPMDIVYSCYQQLFESGFNYLFDIERIAHTCNLFERQMAYWGKLFPSQVMIVEYEALVSDQEKVTRDLLNFCELDWEQECLDFHNHVGRVITASDLQVREKLHKGAVGKWRKYSDYLKPAADILGVSIANTNQPQ